MPKKILVVDDSALVRRQLIGLLEENGFACEPAKHGKDALDKVSQTDFDAITMDINMPVMDGLTAVQEIMQRNPTPILMVSSLTTEDAPATLEAMELGAIDYVAKPGTLNAGLEVTSQEIVSKVTLLSRISKRRLQGRLSRRRPDPVERKEVAREARTPVKLTDIRNIVLIGASTGGPNLIEDICAALPADFPHPVCVVQHMPEKFTRAFAERLDRVSNVSVIEAEHNMELAPGCVYIAKGGVHLHFAKKVSGKVVLRQGQSSRKRFFTPSVDEMFFSSLEVFDAKKILAIELTGIGDDGADGMVAIKKAGGITIAESEETATVYGMPKEAYVRGGTLEVLPFPKIVQKIVSYR